MPQYFPRPMPHNPGRAMAKVLLATEDRRLADELGGILVELGHTFVTAAPTDGDIPERLSGVEAVITDGAAPPGLETGGVPVLFLAETRPEAPRENGTDAYHLSRPLDRRELHFKLECALRHVHSTSSDAVRDEEWFRTLFEYAPDAYYICDLNGIFIDGNRAAEEITGYKRQELIGKSFFQVKLLPATALPEVTRLLQESRSGRRTGPDELFLTTKKGGEIPVEISSYPIIMGGRHLVLGIARDISARKKVEEKLRASEESFRLMFELSPESITLLDRTGRVITTNSKIHDWLGYRPEEIIGRNLAELPILSKLGLFKVLRQFRRRIKGQDVPPYEAEFLTRDGRPVYGRITASPIRNEAGEVVSVLVMISDVTRERRAEEELRTSHDLLDRIFGGMRDAVAVIGYDYRIREVNDSFLRTYGTSREEVLGKRCYEATHHRVEPCLEDCRLKKVFSTAKPQTYKHAHRTTDGGERIVEISLFPLKNAQGKVESVVEMEHDVTSEMRHAEALRAARDQAQTYLDMAGVIILALDADGVVTLINQRGCELLGRPEKDILGKNWHDCFIPQWSRERIEYTFNRLMAGETEPLKYVESYILTADGRMRLVAWNNTVFTDADGKIAGTLSSGEDITERRQAETALRESEKRFRDFFDNAPEYCYMVSPEGAILDVNRAALEALGYEKKELVGASLVCIYAPEAHKKMERLFAQWKGTGAIQNEEMVIQTKGGEKRHVLLSATTVLGRDGEPVHSISVQRDVTDRRRAEVALRESEEKYRQLVERANDAIVIIQDERLKYVNPRMAELLGYTEEDMQNARFSDFLEPGEKREVFARYRSRMAGEEVPSTYETVLLRQDGRRVRVEVNAGMIAYDGRPADLVFLRDITDRQAAESALRESEAKLKATLDALPDILFEVDRRGRIYDFRAPDAQALYV
ncbi:MAG TPA: PAS domain S-box protein, partial [Candidatus Coatesbacteria bacterium]|nr:PAS domain S-box protein [Candidatus Coatesbacteria bacterium]